jgi:hypothetical protein
MKSSKISIVIVDQQSHCLQQVHSNLLVRYKVPAKIYPPDIKASLFNMTTLTHYFTREQNKSIQSELGVKPASICALVCKRHEQLINSHCLQQVQSSLLISCQLSTKMHLP